MGFFSFIENFFFISLGVVFILVLLLVYHFKQRMSSVERKGDTMYELVSNMVKEIRFLRAFYPSKEEEQEKIKEMCFSGKAKSIPEQLTEIMNQTIQQKAEVKDSISYTIVEPSNKIVVSDDSESDSGSDLESGESDTDSDSESDSEEEGGAIFPEDKPLTSIGVEEVSLDLDVTEVTVEPEVVEPEVVEPEVVEPEVVEPEPESVVELAMNPVDVFANESSSEDEAAPVYTIEHLRKMNINQLKSIAISSGVAADTSKMKKNELISLLHTKDE